VRFCAFSSARIAVSVGNREITILCLFLSFPTIRKTNPMPEALIGFSFRHVRYWHKADIPRLSSHVRFRGKSGHQQTPVQCLQDVRERAAPVIGRPLKFGPGRIRPRRIIQKSMFRGLGSLIWIKPSAPDRHRSVTENFPALIERLN
jgi:hypothetical protein